MKGKSNFWGEMLVVSYKQIEFAFSLNTYRKKHDLSQVEMTRICNLYGEPHGVKFTQSEISAYERMKKAPHKAKFQVLSNVLNLE